MIRSPLNIIEQHVEKAVLGLTGLFLLTMAFLYLVRTPNKIEYGNQTVGPAELPLAIRREAESLQSAVRSATPPAVEVRSYSRTLEKMHSVGILNSPEGTALPETLPLAVDFGMPVPSLMEEEEASGDVALVTPLPPTGLSVRSGRSMVIRQPTAIGQELTRTPVEDSEDISRPAELPWVTIAGYFSIKAQRDAMASHRYAPYRSRVYAAGLDVQRQEMLADGEFSPWQDVISKATPRVDVPDPEFDPTTGAIINKDSIERMYELVKAHQPTLAQPPFYPIVRGDPWRLPPLEGYAAAVGDPTRQGRLDGEPDPRVVRGPDDAGRPGHLGPRVSRSGGPPPGSPGARPTGGTRVGRDEARADLDTALKAYSQGNLAEAETMADRVIRNSDATRGDVRMARKVLNSVTKLREQQYQPPVQTRTTEQAVTVVTHPQDPSNVALWFHDDTVESGKTYRYRMRVRLWNRYYGQMRALKDPEQAKQSLLVGEWSLPSEAVTVAPSTHFFLTGSSAGRDAALVKVFKWLDGAWKSQSFTVSVGEPIGGVHEIDTGILDPRTLTEERRAVDFGTGAVVLDLRFDDPVFSRDSAGNGRFNLRERESLVMTYLDPADGQIKERVQLFDRNDPLKKRLEEEEEQI